MPSNSNNTWALTGKILTVVCTVVLALAAVIGIIQIGSAEKAQLEADVILSPFSVPPIDEETFREVAETAIPKWRRSEVTKEFSTSDFQIFSSLFEQRFSLVRGFVTVRVKNVGELIAEDIVVRVEGGNIYVVSNNNNLEYVEFDENGAKIGDLRQNSFVDVFVWTDDDYWFMHEFDLSPMTWRIREEISVSFSRGIATLNVYTPVTGLLSFVDRWRFTIYYALFIICIFVAGVIFELGRRISILSSQIAELERKKLGEEEKMNNEE